MLFKVIVSMMLVFFGTVSCSTKPTQVYLDDESIPIEVRYAGYSVHELRVEKNRTKERVYAIYNQTAKEENQIICYNKRYRESRVKRVRLCTTKRHKDELSRAAKVEYCKVCSGEIDINPGAGDSCDCDEISKDDMMNNRLANHRAMQQMKRIYAKIHEMAKTDPVLMKLNRKVKDLQRMYLVKELQENDPDYRAPNKGLVSDEGLLNALTF